MCKFLETPASATEHLPQSKHVVISGTGKIFDKLEAACKVYIDTERAVLKDASGAMFGKL